MKKVKGTGNFILVGNISNVEFFSQMGIETNIICKRYETFEKAQKKMFQIFKELFKDYTQRFKNITLEKALERKEFEIDFEEEYDPDDDEYYAKNIDIDNETKEGHIDAEFEKDNMYFDKRAAHTRDFSHELAAHS
jgi:hypothetical protein